MDDDLPMPRPTVVRPNTRLAFQELVEDAGGVVLHLETARYHGMNPVGALVWTLLGDGTTFGALLDGVRERIDDPPPDIAVDIATFLRELEARDLVAIEEADAEG